MKKKRKNTGSYIFIAVAAALTYYFFFRGDYSVLKYVENKNKYEKIKAENQELTVKIEEQKKTNELLKNRDPLEMEKKARAGGMTKEGETVYIYEVEKEK
jgi:cell division protein FtsB